MQLAGANHGIRPAEQSLLARFREMAGQAANEYRPVLTAFLNPRQRVLAEVAATAAGVAIFGQGGFTQAEMQRVIFAPEYFTPEPDDFDITILACDYAEKFTRLHHSTILGTLVHQGIDRSVFGDIITRDPAWQIAVSTAMVPFVVGNVTQIGKTKVQWHPVTGRDVLSISVPWHDHTTVVSALRVDAIVAGAFNLSRTQVKDLIASGHIQVNWLAEGRADAQLVPGDMVSVRCYGRVQLQDVLGMTEKNRWRVALRVLVK